MSVEKEKLYQALGRLNRNHDFQVFKEHLNDHLKAQVDGCINADNPARNQGAAQVLKKIIDELDGAEDVYRKLTNHEIPLEPTQNAF